MQFKYTKKANIEIGQQLYGIIAVSRYTYDGVYPITVESIDYNGERVIFEVDQPCGYVYCSFYEMKYYVFKTEQEAKKALKKIDFGAGLFVY